MFKSLFSLQLIWALGLSAAAQAYQLQEITDLVVDPEGEWVFTIDNGAHLTAWNQGLDQPIWRTHLTALVEHHGGMSIAHDAQRKLLAACSRRPIEEKIVLVVLSAADGQVLFQSSLDRNADGELLAACNRLRFHDDSLLFNDVSRIHKFSLRLQRMTHLYGGANRHAVSMVTPNLLVALGTRVMKWDKQTGEALSRKQIIVPGFGRWNPWELDSAISSDGRRGFVIGADEGQGSLVWVDTEAGSTLRVFALEAAPKIAKAALLNAERAAAVVDGRLYLWSFVEAQPSVTDLFKLEEINFVWSGHEDVAVNIIVRGDPIEEFPRPKYPPEYHDVSSPHAFPLDFYRSGVVTVTSNGQRLKWFRDLF